MWGGVGGTDRSKYTVMPSLLIELICRDCGHQMPPDPMLHTCTVCGSGWLISRYDYEAARAIWAQELIYRDATLWRYEELLPANYPGHTVSMGEGWTPLIRAARLPAELNLPHIYIKDERQSATGSFKDRQASVEVALLKQANIHEYVLSSTGNKAAAYAAYCARAGIRLWIFLTSMVPGEKLRELGLYGAEVIKIAGTYDQAKKVANDFATRRKLFIEHGSRSVACIDGMKTLAFEVAEQLSRLEPTGDGKWRAPDWYIQAVSGGIGPIAVWQGFQELYAMGLIDKLPRLAIVQTEGCAPMVEAWERNLEKAEAIVPRTRIAVLATGDPGRSYQILRAACLETGGTMVSVNDGATFRAMRRMARVEGYSMEPATAVAFAGLEKLAEQGILHPDDVIVVNCSGHTFPAEKHVLEDQYVLDLQLGQAEEQSATAPNPRLEEGLESALAYLDEQVTTVVIIDDNPQDSRLIRRLLQSHKNYRVFEANNPRDGLDLVKQRKPDLVVTDLTMPDMDGFMLLEVLKGDPETRHIPVVVVSAKTLTPEERTFLERRANSLWQKGNFNTRELVAHVVNTLGAESDDDNPLTPIQTTVGQVAEGVKSVLESMGHTTILVIDDNRRDSRLIRRILENTRRYHVYEAYSGEEAWLLLAEHIPSLIVLDLMLPDTDGLSLMQQIKNQERYAQIPIVILTAKELSEDEKQQFRSYGCSIWIKPALDRQALVSYVDKVVDQAQG